jgi:DNA-binding transcriptional ArsR family regulator
MVQIDPKKLVENAGKASRLLKSMSHPSRLMVLCYLMNGEHPVSALNQAIPLSQSALSQHLAGLRQAGLVDTRRESQTIHYRLNSKAVSGILETLYRIYCDPNTEE